MRKTKENSFLKSKYHHDCPEVKHNTNLAGSGWTAKHCTFLLHMHKDIYANTQQLPHICTVFVCTWDMEWQQWSTLLCFLFELFWGFFWQSFHSQEGWEKWLRWHVPTEYITVTVSQRGLKELCGRVSLNEMAMATQGWKPNDPSWVIYPG